MALRTVRVDDDPILRQFEDDIPGINSVNTGPGQMPENKFFSKKISKCFDYSTKFGYVYFINNTHIGICFTDFSNIIRNMAKEINEQNPLTNTTNYDYIYLEKDAQSTQNFDEIGLENYLGSKNTSKDIVKKFDIFKKIVEKHQADFNLIKNDKRYEGNQDEKLFFIKKYLTSKNATLFRLSNKLVQIMFTDGTEVIFSTKTNNFIYKDKRGDEIQESIQSAMTGNNQDIIKKIKLAKNMMIYFVKSHKSKKLPK